jgi:hypothetical protein
MIILCLIKQPKEGISIAHDGKNMTDGEAADVSITCVVCRYGYALVCRSWANDKAR